MFPLYSALSNIVAEKEAERERDGTIEVGGRGIKSAIIARLNYETLVTSQWLHFAFFSSSLSFLLYRYSHENLLSLSLSSPHPPAERRDIARLFKRDNLNLSLVRLLRQTRKDLFYDVNKILGDCANWFLGWGRRKYSSIAILLLQVFSIKNYLYILLTGLNEIVSEKFENEKLSFSKNSLLFFPSFTTLSLKLSCRNERNASYISLETARVSLPPPTLKTLCYRGNPVA